MKLKKYGSTEKIIFDLTISIAEELNVTIWDVCFEKEGASWYLRVFIDKHDGINISDCEDVSRKLSDILDATDPISQAYYLEVGSAGLERELVKEEHLAASINEQVRVRLIRVTDGQKDILGTLVGYDKEGVTLDVDGEKQEVKFADAAFVKLYEEF